MGLYFFVFVVRLKATIRFFSMTRTSTPTTSYVWTGYPCVCASNVSFGESYFRIWDTICSYFSLLRYRSHPCGLLVHLAFRSIFQIDAAPPPLPPHLFFIMLTVSPVRVKRVRACTIRNVQYRVYYVYLMSQSFGCGTAFAIYALRSRSNVLWCASTIPVTYW